MQYRLYSNFLHASFFCWKKQKSAIFVGFAEKINSLRSMWKVEETFFFSKIWVTSTIIFKVSSPQKKLFLCITHRYRSGFVWRRAIISKLAIGKKPKKSFCWHWSTCIGRKIIIFLFLQKQNYYVFSYQKDLEENECNLKNYADTRWGVYYSPPCNKDTSWKS